MGKEPVNGHCRPVPEDEQDLPKLRPPAERYPHAGAEEVDHPVLESNGCRTPTLPGESMMIYQAIRPRAVERSFAAATSFCTWGPEGAPDNPKKRFLRFRGISPYMAGR